jgi:NADPH-dependent curcumin reductase CurA
VTSAAYACGLADLPLLGETIGESRCDHFAPGDIVTGHLGWQDYAVVDPQAEQARAVLAAL